MTQAELLDIQAANIEAREAQRRDITRQAMGICGASSANAFLCAVEFYQDAIAEIERKGKCLVCGWGFIPGTSVCCDCGRDNS